MGLTYLDYIEIGCGVAVIAFVTFCIITLGLFKKG